MLLALVTLCILLLGTFSESVKLSPHSKPSQSCAASCFIKHRPDVGNIFYCDPQKERAPIPGEDLFTIQCTFDWARQRATFFVPVLQMISSGSRFPDIDFIDTSVADTVNREFARWLPNGPGYRTTIHLVLRIRRINREFVNGLKLRGYLRLRLSLCHLTSLDSLLFMEHRFFRLVLQDDSRACTCRPIKAFLLFNGDCLERSNCHCDESRCSNQTFFYLSQRRPHQTTDSRQQLPYICERLRNEMPMMAAVQGRKPLPLSDVSAVGGELGSGSNQVVHNQLAFILSLSALMTVISYKV